MLTLYDAARCPYCARVRIVLAEKGVEWETVEIDLEDRPGWLYEKNPAGKVPVLEEDGWVLPESAVISEYVNERYPEPPLWPADPGARAAGRLLVFRFDDFSDPYYDLRRGKEGARERFEQELAFLDSLLETMPWLSGTSLRPRRQRLPALGPACSRPARRRARPVLGALPLARARSRATIGRGRARRSWPGRGDGDVERDELRRRLGESGLIVLDVRGADGVRRTAGRSVRPAARQDRRRAEPRRSRADDAHRRADPGAAAGGGRSRCLLPFRFPLGARRPDPSRGRDRRPQLSRLLARVVTRRVAALGDRLDRLEKGTAEVAPGLVPRRDPRRRLPPQRLGVGDVVGILVEPSLHLGARHLGVELDPVRALQPERLCAELAPCELDGAGRELVGVVVPLEGVELRLERAQDGIVSRGLRQLDLEPADLGLASSGAPTRPRPARAAARRGRRRRAAARARARSPGTAARLAATDGAPPDRDASRRRRRGSRRPLQEPRRRATPATPGARGRLRERRRRRRRRRRSGRG